MRHIQTKLTEEEDAILSKASKIERRSKREQLAYSAIQHAKLVVKNYKERNSEKEEDQTNK